MQQKSASCHTGYQNCPLAPRPARIVFLISFKYTSDKKALLWNLKYFLSWLVLIDVLKSLPTVICCYWWTAFLKAVLQSLSALHNREGSVKWNCTYWKQLSPECLDYSDYLIYKLPLQVIIRMSKNMWKMWATAGIQNQIISHNDDWF